MKKIMLLIAVIVSSSVFSQAIQEGEGQLNAGIGLTSNWGLPIYVGLDYGVAPDITAGVQVSFATSNRDYGYGVGVDGTWYGFSINGNYHFNSLIEIEKEWDVYAGLSLAYNYFSWDYPNSYPQEFRGGDGSGIGLAAQVGGRYFFSDDLAINAELGGGSVASGVRIGVTYIY